jgi:hypothetical protein
MSAEQERSGPFASNEVEDLPVLVQVLDRFRCGQDNAMEGLPFPRGSVKSGHFEGLRH